MDTMEVQAAMQENNKENMSNLEGQERLFWRRDIWTKLKEHKKSAWRKEWKKHCGKEGKKPVWRIKAERNLVNSSNRKKMGNYWRGWGVEWCRRVGRDQVMQALRAMWMDLGIL
jgi:hypothetical protein